MDKHEVLADSKELYWVYCPKENDRLPLAEKPKFCPMCGEKLVAQKEPK